MFPRSLYVLTPRSTLTSPSRVHLVEDAQAVSRGRTSVREAERPMMVMANLIRSVVSCCNKGSEL